jgi:hypothetical protein
LGQKRQIKLVGTGQAGFDPVDKITLALLI